MRGMLNYNNITQYPQSTLSNCFQLYVSDVKNNILLTVLQSYSNNDMNE